MHLNLQHDNRGRDKEEGSSIWKICIICGGKNKKFTNPLERAGGVPPLDISIAYVNHHPESSQRPRAEDNVGRPKERLHKPVSCFLSSILTCLVLGSFPPLSLTYISHPSFSSGSAGRARVTWPLRNEGRAGKYLSINFLECYYVGK